jgi:hypothetical protein
MESMGPRELVLLAASWMLARRADTVLADYCRRRCLCCLDPSSLLIQFMRH